MKENKNYKSIYSIAIIMTVIALSIGNIINIRSITVYKVVSLLLPFLFIYYMVRTKRKFYWNGFFTLMGIFILANLCMFGIISNPHSIRQKLFFIARLSGHGIVMLLLYNFLYGQKTEQINKYLSLILYVSSSLNIIVSIVQIVKNDLLPQFLRSHEYLYFSRASGLFMDPNYNGFYVVICIFLLFYLHRYSIIQKTAFITLLIGVKIKQFSINGEFHRNDPVFRNFKIGDQMIFTNLCYRKDFVNPV